MTSQSNTSEPFREKVRRLRRDIAARGEDSSFAMPPAWRLAWRLGWTWTPPLFRGYWINALTLGGAWGLIVLVIAWIGFPYISRSLDELVVALVMLGGAFFGLLMAALLRSQRKRMRLPSWCDY